MKKFLLGVFVTNLYFVIFFNFGKITGPTKVCRQDGLVNFTPLSGCGCYVTFVDPKTKESFDKEFPFNPRYFYNLSGHEIQYATWKEDNWTTWDVELHLHEAASPR